MHTPPGPAKIDTAKYVPGVKLGLGRHLPILLLDIVLMLSAAYNPKELEVLPKTWCRTLGPVVFESDNDIGGHFFATEHPEVSLLRLLPVRIKASVASSLTPRH